ncbi:MAG: glycosyltransferase family 2 protein, partial [Muribaculaceae bacterium]|nr:glycosyltransferase family 2 protein [Muribaculaceae bacterium]
MKKISILVPCYNEEQSLPLLYPELKKLMDGDPAHEWEILFVNDGSLDGTLDLLRQYRSQDERINYVSLTRNFGKEAAMLAGFDYVTGDCMVIIDADLQDPPELIPEMVKWWEQGY